MRTDYTEEQMKEMMPKVPVGTECYFSDWYNDGTSSCIISYIRNKDPDMKMKYEGPCRNNFTASDLNDYLFMFPV